MINWIKSLFKSDALSEDIGKVIMPPVDNILTIPEVEPCEPEKDISEPVYAMVKSMFDRPHTWKVHREFLMEKISSCQTYAFKVKDIRKNFEFEVQRRSSWGAVYSIIGINWLTPDEVDYLCTSLVAIQDIKSDRIFRIKEVKRIIERNKVREIYSAS